MHLFSASQISTFLDCKRKWGWQYIAKIQTPQHPSAELGSKVHAQLEKYLRDGTPLDFSEEFNGRNVGELANTALEHLPPPGTGFVEEDFTFESPNGWKYRGFIDLLEPPSVKALTYENEKGETVTLAPALTSGVYDHKTTASLNSWAKSSKDLEADVQGILYAVYSFIRWPSQEAADLQWTYMQTKGAKKSKPVRLRVLPNHAAEVFAEIELVAGEMATMLDSDYQVTSIPPTTSACDAYGGCHFRDRCNLSPEERRPFNMNTETGSLLDRMRARKAAEGIPASPVEAAPAIAPAAINPPESALPPAPPVGIATTDEAPVKKKPGRPKLAAVPTPAPVAAEAAQAAPTDAPAPADASRAPLILFVNCAPMAYNGPLFEKIVAVAKAKIQSEKGLADYRFAEFGHGPGMLANEVAAIVIANKFSSLVIDASTPEGSACLQPLIAIAGTVVRAF